MPDSYRVALLQTQIRHVGSVESKAKIVRENINRARSLIEYTGIRWGDTKLVVLPEWSLTGSAHTRSIEEWEKIALELPGPELELLADAAREFGVYIAGGTMEFDPSWPGRYFNTAYLLDPSGELILRYRKLNGAPQQGQNNYSTPGDLLKAYEDRYGMEGIFPVVDTEIGRLAACVCYDVNSPEVANILAMRGAEVIIHPTGEPDAPHRDAWEMGRRTRAYENCCYWISVNHGAYLSPIDDNTFSDNDFPLFQEAKNAEIAPMFRTRGGSEIVDFNGHPVGGIYHAGEAVVQTAVDLSALRRRRAELNWQSVDDRLLEAMTELYKQTPAFPSNAWLDNPIQEGREAREVSQGVVKRLIELGVFA